MGQALFLQACQNKIQGSLVPAPKKTQEPNQTQPGGGPEKKEAQPESTSTPTSGGNGPLKGLLVTIDVGHAKSGGDTSAVSGNINEHTQVRKQSEIIKTNLLNLGATVLVHAYDTATLSMLAERGRKAAGSRCHISLHHNAFSNPATQGTEVLVDSRRGMKANDMKLAGFVQSEMVRAIWGLEPNSGSSKDRGLKDQSLSVLNNTPKSVEAAILTEAYFISGTGASQNFEEWSSKSAAAIAKGVEKWFLSQNSMSLAEGPLVYTQFSRHPEDELLYANH
jgi:N-acetylmuramoyl-L-alanine amidase